VANTRQLLDPTVRERRRDRRNARLGLARVVRQLRLEGAVIRSLLAQQTLNYLTNVARSNALTADQKHARFERAMSTPEEPQA
jgi:hypothetical protein